MCCASLRSFLRPETAFFLVLWLLLQTTFRERGFYDPGSLWHPVVGERILTDGLMTTDPFTHTFEGQTWIPQQWGMEVLMALAKRAAGLDGLLLSFSVLTALLFTWMFARMRASGMHWALAAAFTGALMFAGAFHFFVRPHMATIALLGWTMACLVDYDRGRVTVARLATLIPTYILWTNLHGGVLGGIMTFSLAFGGWSLQYLLGRGGPIRSMRELVLVCGILASCALTPFDNPFGLEMLNTWQRIVGSTVLKEVVKEHKALDPTQLFDQLVIGFGLFYCLLFIGVVPKLRSEFRVTWLIPFVWFVLSWKGIRQGPLFAITAGIVLADFWKHTIWFELLKKHGDSLAYGEEFRWSFSAALRTMVVPAVIVAASLGLILGGVAVPVVGHGWAKLDPEFYPTGLTLSIENELRTTGPHAKLYNDANLGGYLISEHPHRKIFMDDRFELYGDAWTRAYVDMLQKAPERIEDYADRFACTHALIVVLHDKEREAGLEASPMETYLAASPRWREIDRTVRAVFYRRVPMP